MKLSNIQVGMPVRVKASAGYRPGESGIVTHVATPSDPFLQVRVRIPVGERHFAPSELKLRKGVPWTDPEGCTHDGNGMVSIPVEWSDETFLAMAKAAHALDITMNEFATRVIKENLKRLK